MTPRKSIAPIFIPFVAVLVMAAALPLPAGAARVTDGLAVLYDFAYVDSVTVADVSGVVPPLDLKVVVPGAVTWLPGGGLTLNAPTLVRSGEYATKIVQAATATDAVTIEAWLTPASTTLSDPPPARIITCSDSPTTRNFTLGQGDGAGDDLWTLRLRSTGTDDNGTPATSTGPGTLTTETTHVVVTRDATGAVGVYLDGALVETALVGGTLQNWSPEYFFALGDELTGGRPWLGTYHLVAVYGRALDHAEVISNFNAGPRGVPVDTAPAVVSAPIPAAAVGVPYTYQVLATGYPAPAFALVAPPAGMAIDPVTGLVTWTPSVAGDYPIEITATNSAGSAVPQTYTLTVFEENPLALEVWHGSDQRVGHLGDGQADFNLLGNVSPVGNVSSVAYNLNGSLYRELALGPDSPRLANDGDFNADLPIAQLKPGENTLVVRATGSNGLVATDTVTVTRQMGGSQELPVNIDWGSLADPQDVGQYVDGKWAVQGDGIRTVETGYDRLFLIGETDWQDYEILVPVTIHQVIADPPNPAGMPPGLGILMRFTGHVAGGISGNDPDDQPKSGYLPFGGLGWLRWTSNPPAEPAVHFHYGYKVGWWPRDPPLPDSGEDSGVEPFGALDSAVDFGPASVQPGGTYVMRMRCETLPDTPQGEGVTRYSWKIWDTIDPEPAVWGFEITQESAVALRRGGVVLVAHHVDATFGDVVITDLGSDPSPVPEPGAGQIVLHQNQPNPFNPLTIIRMDVPRESAAHLAVYDIQGRLVRILFRGNLPAGRRELRWDGRDDSGRDVAGGIYLFRLDADGRSETRKMTLVR